MRLKTIILSIYLFATFISTAQQKKTRDEIDGFKWIEITDGRLRGAENINGQILIPPEFNLVVYHSNDSYFRASINGNVAVFEPDGKCVIAIDRDYSDVYKHRTRAGDVYYTVFRTSGTKQSAGLCDKLGKEIISPAAGYDNIVRQEADGKIWYSVSRDNLVGACDSEGKELIKPQYKSLTYYNGTFHYLNGTDWINLDLSLPTGKPE